MCVCVCGVCVCVCVFCTVALRRIALPVCVLYLGLNNENVSPVCCVVGKLRYT